MGRMTDDVTRLVGEIRTGRDDRERMRLELKHATAERSNAVAHLRSTVAGDIAGARAAWFGSMAPLSRRAGTPGSFPARTWEIEVEPEDVVQQAVEDQSPTQGERRVGDDAQPARKARGRHQRRGRGGSEA